jgi:HlyD family secretion protein
VATDLNSLRIDRSLKSTPAPQSRIGQSIGITLIVIAAVAVAIYFLWPAPAIMVNVATAAPIQAASSGGGDEDVILNATGYIVAAHKIELAPKISGRVEWVGVDMGDKVKKGQVLVRVEQEEFLAAVKQSQGQLDASKAKLQELINGSRPEEIAEAQADLDQAVATENDAAATLERAKTLVATNAVSQQVYDDDVAAYGAAKAVVLENEGFLDLAKINLENTTIRAPIDGTILDRNVELAEFVTTGFVGEGGAKGYVVSLADLNDLRVELDISQNDFNKIGSQQTCYITTDAYPDRKYEGNVDQISPEANRQKATVLVKVKILHPDDLLRPDMNATVAFHRAGAATQPAQKPSAGAVMVPAAAIHNGKVFIVADGKAVERTVQVGRTSLDGAQVTSGLSAGDQVIVNPPANLHSGLAVKTQGESATP